MKENKRQNVPLTEAEIDALIVTVNQVKLGDVHPVRIRALHTGLQELKDTQAAIRINRE